MSYEPRHESAIAGMATHYAESLETTAAHIREALSDPLKAGAAVALVVTAERELANLTDALVAVALESDRSIRDIARLLDRSKSAVHRQYEHLMPESRQRDSMDRVRRELRAKHSSKSQVAPPPVEL